MNPSTHQLESLLARRQSVLADHQQRLARSIHDDITQKLTLLALQLSREANDGETPEWQQKCHGWSKTVIELCQSAREINDELQPRLLDQLGLTAGLQWFARTHGTDLNLSFTPPCKGIPLPSGIAMELFTICRELLTQLYPRIGASHVDIQAEESDGLFWLHFRGNDNGFGRKSDPERDLDVISLYERIRRMGGSVQLATAPGSGTSIVLSFQMSALTAEPETSSVVPMARTANG